LIKVFGNFLRFPKKEITGVLAVPFNTHRTTKIDIGEGTEGTIGVKNGEKI